ncbi:hypothetical protein ACIQMV_14080 [Streptomyces sp. NPDC091412]|uniref:hypothetical protein n=1 Tax=unclassified Streptomyces TaxID=2593676 RepID=UPI001167D499|nr:hypothetical protein TNCT6_42670 [Streptomyces sp. 6-11-2]
MRRIARRPARAMAGAVLTAAAVGGLAAPAYAAAGGRLEVNPYAVQPGGQVTVNTTGCGKKASAAGDASAVGAGPFMLAPSTREGEAVGRFRVPDSAQPGTYEIVAQCAEGDQEVRGDLVVTLMAAQEQVEPRGSMKTGVGGAQDRDPVKTAAGVAALAVAAAGGTWLLHRRARGDGI